MEHEPVLLSEVVDAIRPVARSLIVDCTLGLGGHAAALLKATPSAVRLVGLDVDDQNLEQAGRNLAVWGGRIRLIRANFATLGAVFNENKLGPADAILADLGTSSNQLIDPARGFSFDQDGPLDMRLDRRTGPTAADLLHDLTERELADLLYFQSQERYSRRIAGRICAARRSGRLDSTAELARLVSEVTGGGRGHARTRIHPATRTFMALRMAVNRETEALGSLLESAPRFLREGGRVAIISFHSGEDRLVKESFRAGQRAGIYQVLTRKPIRPAAAETIHNPRSRSARLRVAERTGSALQSAADSR